MMYKKLNKQVICADGFAMSVQASGSAYSTPRQDTGPYTAAEVGYPTKKESLLMQYVEDETRPTETVYAYVPSSVISLVCAKHGGIVEGELPEGIPYLKASSR
jgi:hypothetical protein